MMPASRRAVAWMTFGVVALALLVRLPGIHLLGLHGDEDISTLVARGILDTGLPRLPSGALYLRSPLFHYAIAPLVALGVDWFPRLLSVAFSVATVFAVARAGRTFAGDAVALVGAAFVALSLPEIEIARTIRMYAAYELVGFCVLLVLFRLFVTGGVRWAWLSTPAILFSALVHQLGATLAALLAPLALGRRLSARARVLCLVGFVIAVTLGGGYRLLVKDVIRRGDPVEEAVPIESPPREAETFRALMADDPLGFGREWSFFPILVGAAALTGCAVALFGTRGAHPARRAAAAAALGACAGAAGAHQVGTAVALLLGVLVLRAELFQGDAGRRALIRGGGVVVAVSAAWCVAVVADGYTLPDAVAGLTRWPARLARTYLWPPGLAIFAAIGGASALVRSTRLRAQEGERFILLALLVLTTVRGLLTGRSAERYLVDTGPMWALLAGLGVVCVHGWLIRDRLSGARRHLATRATAIGLLGLMLVLPGTGVRALARYLTLAPGEAPTTPGVGLVPDYRGAAEWLAPRLAPGDHIVASNWLTTYCYLSRVDAWIRWRGWAHQAVYRSGAARDVYLSARVLPDLAALTEYVEEAPAWIVVGAPELDPSQALVEPDVRAWLQTLEPTWTGPREDVFVYRFPADSTDEAAPRRVTPGFTDR